MKIPERISWFIQKTHSLLPKGIGDWNEYLDQIRRCLPHGETPFPEKGSRESLVYP